MEDHERLSTGGLLPKRSTIYYDPLNATALRRPLEPAQYTSVAFGKRCAEAGVRPSMGSVGDAYDNALCESFFATLECELLDRQRFRTQVEARLAIFDFIEGWYNPRRRHSALTYLSPMIFEERHGRNDREVGSGSTIGPGGAISVSRHGASSTCYG
jgi:putative transposase